MWVAYYALPDTMEGALMLGCIRMAAVQAPQHKEAFMTLMQNVISRIMINELGLSPRWQIQPAPEAERKS